MKTKRIPIKDLKEKELDVLIIGGGITGACILWDATLRGMKCLLVDKNDYASGTSQATSKLIHGGLRYLKNFEIGLVRESLRERRNLARISPHALYTMGFQIPVYNAKDTVMTKLGMVLYNQLSYDRNKMIHLDNLIPEYRFHNREETIHEIPEIPRERLKGSYLYYDYANLNPERYTTEFIFSARNHGAVCRNYTEVLNIEKTSKGTYLVKLKDSLSGEITIVETKALVNSAGPWADKIESMAYSGMETKLVRSKGIHIITRKICKDTTVVLKKKNGTHLFIIPWRNKTIIGTTDTVYTDSPDALKITQKDIEDLLEEVNFAYGSIQLKLDDVDFYYGGLRPLVEQEGKSTYNASRKLEIMDHKDEGFPGFYSALGGKYTTSRLLAEKLVDRIAEFLPNHFSECKTEVTPILGGNFSDFKALENELQKEFPTISGEKIEILVHRYGSEARTILKDYPNEKEVFVLQNGEHIYSDEIAHIASKEDIQFASDFYFRRSGVGVPGKPDTANNEKILSKLGQYLGWDNKRLADEKNCIDTRYKINI